MVHSIKLARKVIQKYPMLNNLQARDIVEFVLSEMGATYTKYPRRVIGVLLKYSDDCSLRKPFIPMPTGSRKLSRPH